MKKLLIIVAALGLFTASAQTNVLTIDAGKSEINTIEMTFGGGGASYGGENLFGVDVSISTNPFEKLPNLWVGFVQGFYWEPNFAGSTDINVNWSTHLYKELYINTGWSGGIVYDSDDEMLRTGPEITLQYYVNDGTAFLYSGVNYDMVNHGGENGFRYSFGIGLSF